MKKILTTIAALSLFAGMASAQDLAKATETYNAAAEAVMGGDKAAALNGFKTAMAQAAACGESGTDIVDNCKSYIPQLTLSIAKELYNAKDFDKAIATLKEAVAIADEYEDGETAEAASDLLPKVMGQKVKGLISAKNYDAAIAECQSIVEADTTNGIIWLYLGQSLASTSKNAEAIEAYKRAASNGQATVAKKQISTIYLKESSAALKAQDYEGAMNAALESNLYVESANAYKIAGTAASKLSKNAEAAGYLSKYLELAPTAKDADQIKEAVEALKKL